MINGRIVVDGVVHPYDISPANQGQSPIQQGQIEGMFHHHKLYTGKGRDEYLLEREEFLSEFSHDGLTGALFAEANTDMAILHALPNLGFGLGQLTDTRKMAALRDRFPNRYLFYGTITTSDTDDAIKELEWQVNEIGMDGLKLYPAFFYDGAAHGWKMNDPEFSLPLFEAASDLGVRNIAIHKAIPIGPGSINDFKVDDMDEPLFRFRHINFQIVHAGFTFLEETRVLIHRHPNLITNLESTFYNVTNRPEIFAEAIGELLFWGTPEQIMYGSGANVAHPRPLLDTFEKFEMPQRWVEERGYAVLTDEIKAKIMGGNALRLHGLDEAEVIEKIKDDELSRAKANGLVAPWTALRSTTGSWTE